MVKKNNNFQHRRIYKILAKGGGKDHQKKNTKTNNETEVVLPNISIIEDSDFVLIKKRLVALDYTTNTDSK